MNNIEIWVYNHMRALSAWETWAVVAITICMVICIAYAIVMAMANAYICKKSVEQMKKSRFCLNCLKPAETSPLGSACPHCRQGFIVENWRY